MEYEATSREPLTDGHAPLVSFAQASDSGKARVVLADAQAVSTAGDCEQRATRDEQRQLGRCADARVVQHS